ncbi:MAG TPA: HD domain-containing protein [Clostridiaceae bacterium]|jgi:tRNA nucleotidyltransferase (CCA-adding enzyme)|nr:HD domain-containing protein [Clostridiaceae bacterium]
MIKPDKIPSQIKQAIRLLNEHGFEAYLVGGSVRDLLCNKKPVDYDLTTSARPEQISQVFAGFQVIPIGLNFGTVSVIIEQMPVDITTYRIETEYTDFRHPNQVSFAANLNADLARRDFTINAIAFHPDRGLIDPFSGYQDLKNKIIRTVGQPQERFTEDALRILRALRFAASFGFSVEPQTAKSMHQLGYLLSNISHERIQNEFREIMLSPDLSSILFDFRDVFAIFIPQLTATFDFLQHNPYHEYDVFRHTIEVICNTPPELDVRLAALYHDIGKPATFSMDSDGIGHFYQHPKISAKIARNNMQELKFEKKLIDTVETLVLYHDSPLESDQIILKRCLRKFGPDILNKLITLKKADIAGKSKAIQFEQINYLNQVSLLLGKIIKSKPALQITDLEIDGYDVMALGLKGPQIGQALNQIFDLVLTEKLENKRESLLKALKNMI